MGAYSLTIFPMFYGLDWIATGPPTMRLITDVFGAAGAPILFGWIFGIHQIGAGLAAWLAGLMRTVLMSYTEAFVIAGAACFIAAVLSLAVNRGRSTGLRPALAGA
jgi:hypothetical protein